MICAISCNVIYVSNESNLDSCQNFVCPSILSAFRIAKSNDVISILQGTYSGPDNIDITPSRVSNNSRGYPFSSILISGMGVPGSIVVNGSMGSRFFSAFDLLISISNITFVGFDITHIETNDAYGGSLYFSNCSVTIEHCIFSNISALAGGAIFSRLSFLKVFGSSFFNNTALTSGGAFLMEDSSTSIQSCIYDNNIAGSHNMAMVTSTTGGAISIVGSWEYFPYSFLDIQNTSFSENYATKLGGAIFASNVKTIRIVGSLFDGNVVSGTQYCEEYKNSCNSGGGALFSQVKNVSIAESQFLNNMAGSSEASEVFVLIASTF
jgi:predicted outer membrane repeat protein